MCFRRISVVVLVLISYFVLMNRKCSGQINDLSTWEGIWQIQPTTPANTWSLHTRIPMVKPNDEYSEYEYIDYDETGRKKGGFKVKKKYKKFLLPLLMAYKLKFFALIPVLIGGLLLLTGATGLAGFFFALFAATIGLSKGHH